MSEYDLLGDQLMLALRFAESGFKLDLKVMDEVAAREEVATGEVFREITGRYFMRPESIPGNLAIKAIAIDKERLLLETAPLDVAKTRAMMVEEMMPLAFSDNGEGIIDITTTQPIIRFTKEMPDVLKKDMAPRCLWSINWPGLNAARRKAVVTFADRVYSQETFLDDPSQDAAETSHTMQGPVSQSLQLNLGLQNRLDMEQRPILALATVQMATLEATTRLELQIQPLLALQNLILRMSAEELAAFAAKDLSPEGQRKTHRILIFVLSGRIKRIRPEMNWKEARKMARRLSTPEKK